MYYFLKKSDFNLENYNFDTEIFPRFTKKEQQFLKELIDAFDPKSKYSKININKLKTSKESIEALLESLVKKIFKCRFSDNEKEVSTFYFTVFCIAAIEGNEIIYDFSDSIRQSLESGNIFSRIGIISHLQFSNSLTKPIYKLILKENKHKGVLDLSLEELKDVLKMDYDKYPRFYDLETKILKPIARDIEISENHIWFEKIKDNNSKGGRITGVRLHYNNLYHIRIHRDTNTLVRDYAEYIDDFTTAYDNLYKHLKKHSLEDTKEYLATSYNEFFNSIDSSKN